MDLKKHKEQLSEQLKTEAKVQAQNKANKIFNNTNEENILYLEILSYVLGIISFILAFSCLEVIVKPYNLNESLFPFCSELIVCALALLFEAGRRKFLISNIAYFLKKGRLSSLAILSFSLLVVSLFFAYKGGELTAEKINFKSEGLAIDTKSLEEQLQKAEEEIKAKEEDIKVFYTNNQSSRKKGKLSSSKEIRKAYSQKVSSKALLEENRSFLQASLVRAKEEQKEALKTSKIKSEEKREELKNFLRFLAFLTEVLFFIVVYGLVTSYFEAIPEGTKTVEGYTREQVLQNIKTNRTQSLNAKAETTRASAKKRLEKFEALLEQF